MCNKMERLPLKSRITCEGGSKGVEILKIEGILLIPSVSIQLYIHTWLSLFFN